MDTNNDLQLQTNYRLLVELEARNQAFNTLVDLLGEVVFSCTQEGALTFLNPAWEKTLGYKKEESLGTKLFEYANLAADKASLLQLLKTETEISREVVLKTESGSNALVILRARRRGKDWYGSLYDLSIQKLILQQRAESQIQVRKLSRVAELTDNLVIITDESGNVEWVNQGFVQTTGFALDEIKGKRPGAFLQGPETDQRTILDMRRSIRNCEPFNVEIINYKKSGKAFWAAIDCSPVFGDDEELVNFIAIERDITNQKKHEEALKQAKSNAEELSNARTLFVANMSHEIRTPLNSILGMSSVLETTLLSNEQRACIETISNGGKALLSLVDSVLDFAKIESGQMEFEEVPFSSCEIFEEAIDIVVPNIKEKPIDLFLFCENDIPHELVGDPHRVRQVLLNLLSNAIKFTDKGSVSMSVSWEEEEGSTDGWLVITVKDTGTGIAADKQDDVFLEFLQEDSSVTRKHGGTGLGLSICRQICERAGGSINLKSTLGEGSIFTARMRMKCIAQAPYDQPEAAIGALYDGQKNLNISRVIQTTAKQFQLTYQRLAETSNLSTYEHEESGTKPIPLERLEHVYTPSRLANVLNLTQPNKPTRPSGDHVEGKKLRSLNVLIAEDVIPNQLVMKAMLQQLGISNVTIVNNGVEVIEAAKKADFDVVFLDIHMPKMDGISAGKALFKLTEGRSTKLVALSADVGTQTRSMAEQAGIGHWLTKPLVLSELRELLVNVTR